MTLLFGRALLFCCALAGAAVGQDLLVIAPPEMRPALGVWKAHREAQGLRLAVEEPSADLRKQVRTARARSGEKLRFVLLLGDARQVACAYEDGVVIADYERDPRIANDHHLADLDGDGLPDLAVGRLPADGPEEAAAMLGKVVEYEKNRDFSPWRRRINVVAGVGGFGKLQDWALEQVATKFLTENVPPAYDLHVTYGNPASPFCPPPWKMLETTTRRFEEGALLVAYLGHGNRLRLDRLRYRDKVYPIFDEDAAFSLSARRGPPIVAFVACSTGHFDGSPDCLAEVVIKRPRGPVAVLASSRVSMPYGNGVIAKELLDALLSRRLPTLGEVLVEAKRRTMRPREGDTGRQFIETLALGYQWDSRKRDAERREHIYLYNLFGDPSLRIRHPSPLPFSCPDEIDPGGRLKVVGDAPFSGEALVELVEKRRADRPPRQGESEEAFRAAYERANAWTRATARVAAKQGRFEAELEVPADLPAGDYVVRVYLNGKEGAAVESRKVRVGPRPEAK